MRDESMNHSQRHKKNARPSNSPNLHGNALKSVFEEIRDNWKLEAKSESIERYFFHVSEVKAIETGKKHMSSVEKEQAKLQ